MEKKEILQTKLFAIFPFSSFFHFFFFLFLSLSSIWFLSFNFSTSSSYFCTSFVVCLVLFAFHCALSYHFLILSSPCNVLLTFSVFFSFFSFFFSFSLFTIHCLIVRRLRDDNGLVVRVVVAAAAVVAAATATAIILLLCARCTFQHKQTYTVKY